MLCTGKWVKKIVSCGGVFDLAVEQPQLSRKLPKNENKNKKTKTKLLKSKGKRVTRSKVVGNGLDRPRLSGRDSLIPNGGQGASQERSGGLAGAVTGPLGAVRGPLRGGQGTLGAAKGPLRGGQGSLDYGDRGAPKALSSRYINVFLTVFLNSVAVTVLNYIS